MITSMKEEPAGMQRVTLTLDPVDVDLLDRLARLEGKNRSAELRFILGEARPVLRATVEAFEAAVQQRDQLSELARTGLVEDLQSMVPEVEAMRTQYLGAMSRLEGAAAAKQATEEPDPRPSNHGGHTPTPTTPPTTQDGAD